MAKTVLSLQNSTSSFAIELLVIRLWSQDGSPVHFKLTNALKKVMETIAVPNHIRVEFVGEFYNKEFQKRYSLLKENQRGLLNLSKKDS